MTRGYRRRGYHPRFQLKVWEETRPTYAQWADFALDTIGLVGLVVGLGWALLR